MKPNRSILQAVAIAMAAALPTLAAAVTSPVPLAFGAQSMGTARTITLKISGEGVPAGDTGPLTVVSSNTQLTVTPTASCLGATTSPCSLAVTFQPGATIGPLNQKVPFLTTITLTGRNLSEPMVLPVNATAERSLVEHYYREILGRASDASGKTFWEGEAQRVSTGGGDLSEVWLAMSKSFVGSSEGKAKAAADLADNLDYIDWLYRIYFLREADAPGLQYWSQQLQLGATREDLQVAFMLSPEFRQLSGTLFGDTSVRPEFAVVHDLFRGLLGRAPDSLGFNFWTATLRSAQCEGAASVRAKVDAMSSEFIGSAEYQGRARTTAQRVTDLFDAFLRRGADGAGATYWQAQMAVDPESVRRAFLASPEFSLRVDAIVAAGCVQ